MKRKDLFRSQHVSALNRFRREKEAKMAILENISEEELEELAGGTIVQVDTSMGTYYVVVDEGHKGRIIRTGTTLLEPSLISHPKSD